MALHQSTSQHSATPCPGFKHQDIEFEIGALASRHGVSLDIARTIVGKCGSDLGCIDEEARKYKLLA